MNARDQAAFVELCERIVEYRRQGNPVKDAIEMTKFTTEEVIEECAQGYLRWINYE